MGFKEIAELHFIIVVIATSLAALGLISGLIVAILHAIGGNWAYLIIYGVVVGLCSIPLYIGLKRLYHALD
jgi:hypothetical protein